MKASEAMSNMQTVVRNLEKGERDSSALAHDLLECLRSLVELEDRNDEGMATSAPNASEWRIAFNRARNLVASCA